MNAFSGHTEIHISDRAKKALSVFSEDERRGLFFAIRENSGKCLGVFMSDSESHYLPTDPGKMKSIEILNSELRRECPWMSFEEQVLFDES